jgi:hypothetical protein
MEGMEDGDARPRQVRYVCGNLRAEMGLLARPLVLSLGRIPGDNSPSVQQTAGPDRLSSPTLTAFPLPRPPASTNRPTTSPLPPV